MDDNLLSSFASAWGQEEPQGLNPGFLPDLLAMSESQLEQGVSSFRTLSAHFETMRGRMMAAQNNLGALIGKKGEVPEDLYETAVENRETFHDVELAIDDILSLAVDDSIDEYWAALRQLEEASESLRSATEELARVARTYQ